MSVAKNIEISSTSQQSFEDAINKGIERATKSVDDIRGAWVKEFNVDIQDGKIVDYRVDMKVTFVIHD